MIQFPEVLADASFYADKKLTEFPHLSVNLRVVKTTGCELAFFTATGPYLLCERMIGWRDHRVRQTCAAAVICELLNT